MTTTYQVVAYRVAVFVAGLAMLAFYSAVPALAAGNVTVETDNSAEVTNVSDVRANTGDNRSRGGDSDDGGDGGNADGNNSGNTGGAGGDGGNGGDGSSIETGSAISTAVTTNEVNHTEVDVRQRDTDCGCDAYDTRLDISSREGNSRSLDYRKSFSYDDETSTTHSDREVDEEESSSASAEGDAESESSTDNTAADAESDGDDEDSESSSESWQQRNVNDEETTVDNDVRVEKEKQLQYEEEEHDNLDLTYSRTYAGDRAPRSNTRVTTSNDAGVTNVSMVGANTGGNESDGGSSDDGGDGGDSDGNNSGNTAGDGGSAGNGGNGDTVSTGQADSLSEKVSVVNRSITRVRR